MAINAGGVYAELELNTGKFDTSMMTAEKQMQIFSGRMQDMGSKMQTMGKTLMASITAPLTALGGLAANAAIAFESAFAGVKKTVDATDAELAKLEKGIRGMAKEIPASATAISEVAEAAGQLGIKTENILDFSRVMIDLGESTNLSATEAASALAQFANITQMSQQDFDRLGSTIVALGNNLATTERDIVNMGMRLAGAGAQIGLSEAQIMAFSGALSSVGIEAEAGGSAFSKVMIDMQLAVETGKNGLQNFAKVAGMSSAEFQRAFKEDAAGAIIAFIQGLSTAEERGMSAIKILDDMGITEIRLRDALLRAAGASDVFTDAVEMGTNAWNENSALAAEAAQRYETTASQLAMLKNKITDIGIVIGSILIPKIMAAVDAVGGWTEKFHTLSPAMQSTIVNLGLVAAAIPPLIFAAGTLISSFSAIAGTFGAAGGAAGIMGAALTVLTGPAGIAVAALAGITVAGYKLYQHFNQEAIPAVQLFGDEVSEATQQAVTGFLDLNDQATTALNQLNWSGQEVTQEMAGAITGNFDQMKDQVVGALTDQRGKAVSELDKMFAETTSLTEQEKENILRITTSKYDEQIKKTEEGHAEIAQIMHAASEEKRQLTEQEKTRIAEIQEEMKGNAIRILSESEEEQKAILRSLELESGKITARQAAEVVKNSFGQKEETIKNADEEYKERIKIANRLRTEGTAEAKAAADEIEAEAKRQKEQAVAQAEEMHQKVVAEAKAQAEGHVNEVDWETGEILTKWQSFTAGMQSWADDFNDKMAAKQEEYRTKVNAWMENVSSTVKQGFSDMGADIMQTMDNVGSYLAALPEQALEWGGNIVQGLIDGISSKVEAAKEAAQSVASAVSDGVKNLLRIQSPSQVMVEFGGYVAEGLAKGIDEKASKVDEAIQKIVNAIKSAAQTMLDDLSYAIQLTNAELDLQAAKMGENATETDKLRLELEKLQAQADNTRERIEVLTAAYETSKKKLGENAEQTKAYHLELVKAQTELAKTETAIKNTTQAIAGQTSETKKLNDSMKSLGYEMDVLRLRHEIERAALSASATEQAKYSMEIRHANESLELLKQKLDMATVAYNASKIATGETSEETRRLYLELLNAELAYTQLTNKINTTTVAYKNQASAAREAAQAASFVETGPPTGSQYEPNPSADVRNLVGSMGNYKSRLEPYADPSRKPNQVVNLAGGAGGITVNTRFMGDTTKYIEQWDDLMAEWGQILSENAEIFNEVLKSGKGIEFYDGLIKISSSYSGSQPENLLKAEDLIRAADGGIATRPTIGIWGEAGAEALLPLEKLQPMMTKAMEQALEYATNFIRPAQINLPKLDPGETMTRSRQQDTTRGGITQNITINSPSPLTPSEVARKNLQVSRQLAMEWGV